MKLDKFDVKACCGRMNVVFKADTMLDANIIGKLVSKGFKELEHFTKAGILYVENASFIITGPIGSDRLQVKCRKSDCSKEMVELEKTLESI